MKKAKNAAKKIRDAQKKIEALTNKVQQIGDVAKHPVRSLGGYVGGRLGSKKIGSAVGSFLGKIVGTGDYAVINNSLTTASSRLEGDSVPTFIPTNRGYRVVHREYIGDVVASSSAGAFTVTSYPVNPGLFTTFPWFSSIAAQFDEWRPNGIVVCFKSLSSFYSGTPSLGTVVIASDYDVLDDAYSSKVEMENSEFAVSGSAATNLIHPLECKPQERYSNLFFTRTTNIAGADNLRFFDLANVQVATAGCAANQIVGELWMSYDITCYKPQVYGGLRGLNALFATLTLTGATAAAPYGTSYAVSNSNIPGMSATSGVGPITIVGTGTQIQFGKNLAGSTWLVRIEYTGTAAVCAEPVLTVAGGLTPDPVLTYTKTISGVANSRYNPGAINSSVWFDEFSLRVLPDSSGTAMTLTNDGLGVLPSTLTRAIMYVWQVNPNT